MNIAKISLAFGAILLATTNLLATASDNEWVFQDIEGTLHEPLTDRDTQAVVLVFVSTQCPIANSYLPQLNELSERMEKQGVAFFLIHGVADVSVEQARNHVQEYDIQLPVVLDPDQILARRTKATVIPEAFVFIPSSDEAVYSGRIDNRYAGYGKKRTVATSSDLEEALLAILNGKEIETPVTEAIGCRIRYAK